MRNFKSRIAFLFVFLGFLLVLFLSADTIQQPARVLGAFATNDCAKLNASGFVVSNGAGCGAGAGFVTTGVTLTANLPVIGNGGADVIVGTRSGNTAAYVTTTGAQTSGRCVEIDASGNHIAAAGACGSGGSGDWTGTYCVDATGSTTTYTCSGAPTVASYTNGMVVTFVPQVTNTASSTVNIDGLGAVTIKWTDGSTNLFQADLIAGGVYALEYDGTNFRNINGPDGPWTALSYSNSWTDFGSGFQVGQYRKLRNGDICIRATLTEGTLTAGTTIFTLPVGYRVSSTTRIVGFNDNAVITIAAQLTVNTNGTVQTTIGLGSNYLVIPQVCVSEF